MNIKKKTLQNGLRIISVPMKDNATTTVLVLVEAGSKYESKKEDGISHFLEHVCFKGTLNRPTSLDILHELDSLGAQTNAFTGHEFTGYYAKAHFKHTDKLLEIISDVYLNSNFPEKEIQKEKGVILDEMNMYQDLPQREIYYIFTKLLYGDQPAGRTILGDKKVILSTKRKDFINYRKKHYVAKSTLVVVAGGIDEKKIEKKIEALFKGISEGPKGKKLKVVEKQTSPKVSLKRKKTGQAHIALGVRTFSIFDKRMPTLEVLNAILGQGMSSRLFQKIREGMGVGYYVRSSVDDFTDHGFLATYTGVETKRVEEVVKAILEEYQNFKNEEVSDKEIAKAKEYIIGNMAMNLEGSDEVAEFCGVQEILKKKINIPKDVEKKIREVTASDIMKVAKDVFKKENLNLVIIGDLKSASRLESLLKNF